MLRVIFVLGILAVGIRYSFRGAFYLLLLYLWNAYFRPESWVWSDLVAQMRLSLLIGGALLVATLFSGQRFRFGTGPLLMLAFLVQTVLSTALSPSLAELWPFWTEFAKAILITYLIYVLVDTEERLRLTFIIVALSLSFEGAKQGWLQLFRNPGTSNSNSWPMLGDNNGVAVGMLMLLALIVALIQTEPRRLYRLGAWFVAVGVMFRAIFTYSRGGFLSASALALHYAARSRRKVRSVLLVVALASLVAYVMPQQYWDRIATIETAAETTEASRIGYWMIGLEMASERPFVGVGINAYTSIFDQYDPTYGASGNARDIHSSWFGLLAELGYPGLLMFVALIAGVFLTAVRARRAAKSRPDIRTLAVYATALESMVIVFAVGGTFITLQYKEFIWHVFAFSWSIDALVRQRLAEPLPVEPAAPPEPIERRHLPPSHVAVAPIRLREPSRSSSSFSAHVPPARR